MSSALPFAALSPRRTRSGARRRSPRRPIPKQGVARPLRVSLISLGCLLAGSSGCEAEPPPETMPTATIREQKVSLEIARTPAEQARGLGYRDSLDWGRGMLFLYDEAHFYGFWMKGMRFDLDIVWIRENRIIDISHRVKHSPDGPGESARPREVADSVLEVPAGFASAVGWRVGDRVKLDLGPPATPAR